MAQPSLALTTLGGLEIRREGQLVSNLGSRKAEALLIYLACTRRPISRETLAALLWGDVPQVNALASLSVALNQIKKKLAPFITAERHTIMMNEAAAIWLDTAVLEAELSAWEKNKRKAAAISPDAIAQLETPLALYKGDFLAGFSVRDAFDFEEWALLERERLRHLALTAFSDLIHLCHDDGRYRTGITYARQMLSLDPLREDAHQLLTLMLARQGQWSSALAQSQRCRQILMTELGVEPTLETTNLFERIRLAAQEPRHNIPAQPTSFIGRETELDQVCAHILNKYIHLLTITGPGGIGKTRLALQAGLKLQAHFINGVRFVDLAPIQNPDLIIQKIALILGLEEGGGRQKKTLLDRIIEFIHAQELLLIWDNCEHLINTCAEIGSKIQKACPEVTLLITSRERLNISGETIWQTPPMKFPVISANLIDAQSAAIATDAVHLFLERAKTAVSAPSLNQDTMPDVVDICRQVEGIPLAIELAASRLRLQSLSEIRLKLSDRFQLLAKKSRSDLPRQQTLLATIEWSYDLLSELEQIFFERLALFRGGFDLEAVTAVCWGYGLKAENLSELLLSLLDKSLVIAQETTGQNRRFRMLETIREFGWIKLEQRKYKAELQRQHAGHFMALAEKAYPELEGPQQLYWGDRLYLEYDNIRLALEWSINNKETEIALRLGAALWHGIWLKRGIYQEGRHYLSLIEEMSRGIQSRSRGLVIIGLGELASAAADYDEAAQLFQASLALGNELHDINLSAWSIHHQAEVKWVRGSLQEARDLHRQSLAMFRQINDQNGIAWQLYHLALIAQNLGEFQEANDLLAESLPLHQKQGNKWAIAWAKGLKSELLLKDGNKNEARRLLQEVLELNQEIKSKRGQIFAFVKLGDFAFLENTYEIAADYYQQAFDVANQIGDESWISLSQFYLARVIRLLGQVKRAQSLLDQAFMRAVKNHWIIIVIRSLAEYACMARLKGELGQAAILFGASEKIQQKISPYSSPLYEGEIALIKASMGENAFQRAWEKGTVMSLETAVAYLNSTGFPASDQN